MKKTIIITFVCCLVFAGYLVGQNQSKEKHIENCCCKHTQQIAEDLRWIRRQMEKPYVPPEIPLFEDPGSLTPIKKQPTSKNNFETEKPNINIPKIPRVKK